MKYLLLFVLILTFTVAGFAQNCQSCTGCASAIEDEEMTCAADETKVLKRGFFDRLFGKPATETIANASCWTIDGDFLTVNVSEITVLTDKGSAVRIGGEGLEEEILLVYGDDGKYYAFKNKCTHSGRKLDPVPGGATVQCCSVSHSTFDYCGKKLSGPAKGDLTTYPVKVEKDVITITLN